MIVYFVCLPDAITEKHYILMEQRLCELYKTADEYRILKRYRGSTLANKTYKPLFPYFADLKQKIGAFRVLIATFVTTDQGTGVVHEAPYFGEVRLSEISFYFHIINILTDRLPYLFGAWTSD
jgi:isoleucyl-tRNA synthetase